MFWLSCRWAAGNPPFIHWLLRQPSLHRLIIVRAQPPRNIHPSHVQIHHDPPPQIYHINSTGELLLVNIYPSCLLLKGTIVCTRCSISYTFSRDWGKKGAEAIKPRSGCFYSHGGGLSSLNLRSRKHQEPIPPRTTWNLNTARPHPKHCYTLHTITPHPAAECDWPRAVWGVPYEAKAFMATRRILDSFLFFSFEKAKKAFLQTTKESCIFFYVLST